MLKSYNSGWVGWDGNLCKTKHLFYQHRSAVLIIMLIIITCFFKLVSAAAAFLSDILHTHTRTHLTAMRKNGSWPPRKEDYSQKISGFQSVLSFKGEPLWKLHPVFNMETFVTIVQMWPHPHPHTPKPADHNEQFMTSLGIKGLTKEDYFHNKSGFYCHSKVNLWGSCIPLFTVL